MEAMEVESNQNPKLTTTSRNLNDLPEKLLLHILTFLPTLDSIQTSLLSRKWRSLWSRVPSLNFTYQDFPAYETPAETRQFFAEFVDRVLIRRPNSPIHTFLLSFIYHDDYRSHVDSWIHSAVTRLHARELHLDFFIDEWLYKEESVNHKYDFPFSVLKYRCVEVLRLTLCDLTLPANLSTVSICSVRSMFIDQVHLTDPKLLTSKNPLLKSSMLPNLSLLKLRTRFTQYEIIAMAALLKLSPNLETMVLEIDNDEYLDKKEEDATLSEEFLNELDLSMPSLKQVTMAPYTGTEEEVDVVTILTRQGVALEKIVLEPVQVGDESDPPQMVLHRRRCNVGNTSHWMFSTTQDSIDHELYWGIIHWPIPRFRFLDF